MSEDVGRALQLIEIVARLRVALGFACGVLVYWLARPTADSQTDSGNFVRGGLVLRN